MNSPASNSFSSTQSIRGSQRSECVSLQNYEFLCEIDQRVLHYSQIFRSFLNFSITRGNIVIAYNPSWNKWFRARILSINKTENLVKVGAIDYRQEMELPRNFLLPLCDEWLEEARPVNSMQVLEVSDGKLEFPTSTPYSSAPSSSTSFFSCELNSGKSSDATAATAKANGHSKKGEEARRLNLIESDANINGTLTPAKKMENWRIQNLLNGHSIQENDECDQDDAVGSDKCVNGKNGSPSPAKMKESPILPADDKRSRLQNRLAAKSSPIQADRDGADGSERCVDAKNGTPFPAKTNGKSISSEDGKRTLLQDRLAAKSSPIQVNQDGAVGSDHCANGKNGTPSPVKMKEKSVSPADHQCSSLQNRLLMKYSPIQVKQDDGNESSSSDEDGPASNFLLTDDEFGIYADDSSDVLTICNDSEMIASISDVDADNVADRTVVAEVACADGYDSDDTDVLNANFDSVSAASGATYQRCTDAAMVRSTKQFTKQMNDLAAAGDSVPLLDLSLKEILTVCIGAEATECSVPEFYEIFASQIANQLKQLPVVSRLQKMAWPHLMGRKSAIIIDPSPYVADLVYLPVVCTHLNDTRHDSKRFGPITMIVCKTQDRCTEIAKRCLSFLFGGHMLDSTICIADERKYCLSELVLQKCKIFVTSTYFLGHWNTMQKTLRKFNALQHIVFDNVDNVKFKTFQEIMKPISDGPKQLIVVSNVYKSVLNDIFDKGNNDMAIFSGPLDIAVMAKSKLDVIIAKRSEISRPTGQKYKFDHVLERIRMSSDKTFMIICDRNQYVNAIKKELERLNIKITILTAKETGERYDYHRFNYNGKEVHFCHYHVLKSIGTSSIAHFFVYKFITSPQMSMEFEHMLNRFESMIKANQFDTAPVISLFCYDDAGFEPRELAENLFNYQRMMHCASYWAHVSSTRVLQSNDVFCLEFEKYGDRKHMLTCKKRHRLDEEDEPSSDQFMVKFRILHVYSPIHYCVEVHAQRRCDQTEWVFLNSKSYVVEIFMAQWTAKPNQRDRWDTRIFQSIIRRPVSYAAKVFLKLHHICFIDELTPTTSDNDRSFLNSLSWHCDRTDRTMRRLNQMMGEYKKSLPEVEHDDPVADELSQN